VPVCTGLKILIMFIRTAAELNLLPKPYHHSFACFQHETLEILNASQRANYN